MRQDSSTSQLAMTLRRSFAASMRRETESRNFTWNSSAFCGLTASRPGRCCYSSRKSLISLHRSRNGRRHPVRWTSVERRNKILRQIDPVVLFRRSSHGFPHCQRQNPQGRRRARHAAAVGAARLAPPHRHQIRLRHRPVRCLHGAPRWAARALLPDAGIRGSGQESNHCRGDRRHARRQGGAGGLDPGRRAAVRLLPVGPDYERERSSRKEPRADRRRHRRSDERQRLPLRDLQPDSSRYQGCGREREGSMIMGAKQMNISRRGFLKTSAMAGGGLIIGFTLPGATRLAQGAGKEARMSAYLRIAPNNDITVVCGLSEMGQGVHTAIPMLVAEELDADWSRVRVEQAGVDQAFANPIFGMQATGGSTSVRGHWEPMRKAGATARAMLIAAAAQTWKADAADCRTERSMVIHTSGKKLSYGQLAEKAATLTPPKDVKLKDPTQFNLLGKSGTKRLDTVAKSTGKAKFGLDVYLPGMLTAVIAYPPVLGGKVASVNDAKAKAVPGVRQVLQIPSGVAVLADGYWAATPSRSSGTMGRTLRYHPKASRKPSPPAPPRAAR